MNDLPPSVAWTTTTLQDLKERFNQLTGANFTGILLHKKVKILKADPALAALFGYMPAELTNKTLLDLTTTDSREVVLRNIFLRYQEPYAVIGLKKNGATFPIEIFSRVLTYQGHLISVLAIRPIIDRQTNDVAADLRKVTAELAADGLGGSRTSQLRFFNERLRLELDEHSQIEADLRDRARQQAAVAELGQRALVGTSLPVLMNEALSLAAQTLRLEYAGVFEARPGGAHLLLRAGLGWQKGAVGHVAISAKADSPAGYALLSGSPVIIEDLAEETRFGDLALLREHAVVSGMAVIMYGRQQPFGVLGVYTTHLRVFTEDDTHFLQAIANVLAASIENDRWAQQTRLEIAERQRAQAALQQERALLAERVAERTVKLLTANEELARAARLKDEFLANMSHELRTPLTAILGLVEVLQLEAYGPLTEKQSQSMTVIAESGQHLLDMINDILDLSKIEAAKLELEPGPVAVDEVCQSSLQFIKDAAHKKNIQVSFRPDHTVTMLYADTRRLKQILVNLLNNAVKFTPDGGQIGLEVVGDAAQGLAHLTVSDTGIGIAAEDIPRLFEPFVQLDSRLARHYTGTGLGLALVSRLVTMHGGKIGVESNVGQGSRFTVSLPWSGALVDAAKSALPAKPQPPAVSGLRAEAHASSQESLEFLYADLPAPIGLILLAEDEKVTAELLSEYLQLNNYRVVTAHTGGEVLEKAHLEPPDVILMDIQMPEMDGLETICRLRADPALAAIPIIALTALAMRGDRERCLEAGADAYLSKPVNLHQLIQTIAAQMIRRATLLGDQI